MNAERFNDFLRDARLNVNPDDQVIFIYGGAPAHRNPENPGPNTELKKLPPYSPFLIHVNHCMETSLNVGCA